MNDKHVQTTTREEYAASDVIMDSFRSSNRPTNNGYDYDPLVLDSGAGYRGLQYLLVVMSESEAIHWEYETLRPRRDETKKEAEDPKAELNQLGAEGWEFVETIDYEGGGTKYLVFKRPAQSSEPV